MSGFDVELYYWLKNISPLEAAVIGVIISGLIIVFIQWLFRWHIQREKVSLNEVKRLNERIQGDWPEQIRQSARSKVRKWWKKQIIEIVLIFLIFWGVAFSSYLMYSSWSDKNDEEIRKGRLKHIEQLDDFKSILKLRTIKTTILGKEATKADELMIMRWELMCSTRAQNEGSYQGRNDSDRILIIHNSYQACMLERGWYTELCVENEKECVEIPFGESVCTSFTRESLEDPSAVHDSFFRDCTVVVI